MESQKRRYERAVKILRIIAETEISDQNDLPNKYDIFKSLKELDLGTEPTFLAAIDELEDAGLIQPKLIDTHARGGKPSKHYDLTIQGLKELLGGVYALGWKEVGFSRRTNFSTLAKRYSFLLPQIFVLWEKYEEHDLADIVERAMLSVASIPLEEWSGSLKILTRWKREWLAEDPTRRPDEYPGKLGEHWAEVFTDDIMSHIHVTAGKNLARWRKALKEAPELRKPILAQLRRRKTEEEDYVKRLEDEIRTLENA